MRHGVWHLMQRAALNATDATLSARRAACSSQPAPLAAPTFASTFATAAAGRTAGEPRLPLAHAGGRLRHGLCR